MKKILLGVAALLVALAGGYGINEGMQSFGGVARLNPHEIAWLNELAATTTASNIVVSNVASYRNVNAPVATTAASGTLQFACSFSDTAPTFTSSQSATNRWDYVEIVDLEDGSSIDGDTGLTLANTSDVRQFELQINNAKWCTARLTAWTAGTTTVQMLPATNQ